MKDEKAGSAGEAQPDVDVVDPDPLDALEDAGHEDPTPGEITDPDHPDHVRPAEGVRPYTSEEVQ